MVWEYNQHEDFVPYYDKLRGKWAVSVQYLNVWFFSTQEKAILALPKIMEYREKVLAWVEEQNRQYYKRLEEEEHYRKRDLREAKKQEEENEEKLCKELSKVEKKHLVNMLDEGYTDEEIMEIIPISKRAVALKRWHRYKGEKNENNKRTTTRNA